MKKKIILMVIIISSFTIYAQEETLLGNGEVTHGGFGGLVVKFTQVKDKAAVLVGGRGGWIINHSLSIGLGGYGLVNRIGTGRQFLGGEERLAFGYGGMEIEYIIQSDRVIHFTVNTLIGGGGIVYGYPSAWDWDDDDWDYDWDNNDVDAFFTVEPAVNVELNIVSFFRIDVGASYRFVSGINFENSKNEDFSGPSAILTFKFGKF